MNMQGNRAILRKWGIAAIFAILILAILVVVFLLHRLYFQTFNKNSLGADGPVSFIAENLMQRIAQVEKMQEFTSDISMPLFNNGNISFHIHAMQIGQFCPLHTHKGSEEGVFIIKGKGKIRSIAFDDSPSGQKKHTQEFLAEKGGFFFASQGNAHEFINISADEILACLVIHSPPFHGNYFVRESSIKKSPAATYENLVSIGDSMIGAGENEVAIKKIDAFSNVETSLVRTYSPLDENMAGNHDIVIIVIEGEALFEINNRKIKVEPIHFLAISSGTPFRIIPSQSSTDYYLLCFYL